MIDFVLIYITVYRVMHRKGFRAYLYYRIFWLLLCYGPIKLKCNDHNYALPKTKHNASDVTAHSPKLATKDNCIWGQRSKKRHLTKETVFTTTMLIWYVTASFGASVSSTNATCLVWLSLTGYQSMPRVLNIAGQACAHYQRKVEKPTNLFPTSPV